MGKIFIYIFWAFIWATLMGCRMAEHPSPSDFSKLEIRVSNHPDTNLLPSGVWKIRGNRSTVYLAGTSHTISTNQIPLPSPFYAAYRDAQELYVEFDSNMSLFGKARLMCKLFPWARSHWEAFYCPPGRTLGSYLSTNTLKQIQAACGKDLSRNRMTPLMFLFNMECDGLSTSQEKSTGMEEIFTLRARKDGKPIHELDDQGEVDRALKTLDQIIAKWKQDIARRGADKAIQEALSDELKEGDDDAVWRRGDLAAMEKMQAQMKAEYPGLYEKELVARNRQWLGKLEAALKGKNNVFVLVGAAHLAGKDGLLQLLQERGFTAEQVYGTDHPLPVLR